jgi:hypothetical protein
MGAVVRSVLSVLAGVVVAVALIAAVQYVNALVYWPAGVDPNDEAKLKEVIAGLPVPAFLVVLVGYVLGAFCGAGVAAYLAGRAPFVHGGVIGVLLLGASVSNLRSIPHPMWFVIANLTIVLPAALLGCWTAQRLKGRSSRS